MSRSGLAKPTACGLLLLLPRLASCFTVCVLANNVGGYPFCAAGSSDISYNGPDVEVFKYAAGLAGWNFSDTAAGRAAPPESRTWGWSCYLTQTGAVAIPWMLNASMYSTCAVLIGGIGVNTARLKEGVNFGYAIDNGTAQMAIYDTGTSGVDIWSFLRPFTATLWIAFVLTLLVIPPTIWVVEQLSLNGELVFNHITMEDLSQSLYRNILAIFNQDIMYVGSLGGQVVIVAFLFMIMIVVSTYTANLAAFNTVTPPQPTYNSLMDFAGKRILVPSLYAPVVAGLYPTLNFTIANATLSSLGQMLAVRNGEFDVVFETTIILNLVIMALNDCNFKVVGQGIEASSKAQAFHSLFPADVKAEYDLAVVKMAVLGEFDPIINQLPSPACSTASNAPIVAFSQVLGLWIVLSSAAGFGLLCAAVSLVVHCFRKRHKVHCTIPPATASMQGSERSVDPREELEQAL